MADTGGGARGGRPALPATTYYYRRTLGLRETLPAIGAGIGLGVVGFYLARLFLQRTPLVREPGIAQLDERGMIVRRPRASAARR
jgi:hypothetical protein